jgi:hypothetical protein
MAVIYQTPLKCCAQETNENFRVLYVKLSQIFTMLQYAKEVGSTERFIATLSAYEATRGHGLRIIKSIEGRGIVSY